MSDTIPQDTPQGNPQTTFIYALIDPETNEIRYIGKADNTYKRLQAHLRDSKASYKQHWISSLKSRDLKPLIQVVEEVPFDSWGERERYWIDFYRTQGCRLTNTALGGVGGNPSPETRAKISASHKGKIVPKQSPRPKEWRENISKAKRGKKQTPEQSAKAAASRIGRKRSPETMAKMVATKRERTYIYPRPNLGKSPSPETRAKISKGLTGKKLSPETIEKRSASVRGSKRPPDFAERQRATKLGKKRKPFSEEWKRKISESNKRAHAMKKVPPPDAPTLWD